MKTKRLHRITTAANDLGTTTKWVTATLRILGVDIYTRSGDDWFCLDAKWDGDDKIWAALKKRHARDSGQTGPRGPDNDGFKENLHGNHSRAETRD